MKLHIKSHGNSSGMMELLFILPLFIGLLCFITWIGLLLVTQSRMDKHAWVIQTRRTYGSHQNIVGMNKKYKIEKNNSIYHSDMDDVMGSHLSLAFKSFNALHRTSFEKLSLKDRLPAVVNDLFLTAFSEKQNVSLYQLSSEMVIPGSPMDHAHGTKMWLWTDAMNKAGFGYPLHMLGIMELLDIPDLPLGKLGEIAGIFNKSESILKQEVEK